LLRGRLSACRMIASSSARFSRQKRRFHPLSEYSRRWSCVRTATAVMQLVEAGSVDLEEPIAAVYAGAD
jgi:hypothetical protein